jgi:hypothetical protein
MKKQQILITDRYRSNFDVNVNGYLSDGWFIVPHTLIATCSKRRSKTSASGAVEVLCHYLIVLEREMEE